MKLNTAQFKSDPRVAIDIACTVCEKYYEEGCPEIDKYNREDDWYSEGALSGGSIIYEVNGPDDDAGPVYEYVEGNPDTFPDGAEALLEIKWGRHNRWGPGYVKVNVSYPEEWVLDTRCRSVLTDRFGRQFLPAHIKPQTIPHQSTNREQIFEWINTFVDRPRDATGAPGVEFFAGTEGVEQIKSEICNILISEKGADLIAPAFISTRFDISFEYAYNLLAKLEFQGRIVSVNTPDCYYGTTELYGSASEWSGEDTIEKGDSLVVAHR